MSALGGSICYYDFCFLNVVAGRRYHVCPVRRMSGWVTGSLTSIDGAYVSAAPCLLRPPVQAF